SGSTGSDRGTTHRPAARVTKSPTGFVSLIMTMLPVAVTPDAVVALPSITSCAPTMSAKIGATADCIACARVRSIVCSTSRGPTTWPVEKRSPFRIVNVYVLSSGLTAGGAAAISGIIDVNCDVGTSGKAMRLAHVAELISGDVPMTGSTVGA